MTAEPQILHGQASDVRPVVSVIVGRRYVAGPDGSCEDLGDFSFTFDPELIDGPTPAGAMLRRDIDVWGWKDGTDVVVQGAVRRERPTRSCVVDLRCEGAASFHQSIVVTGDRVVEGSPGHLRLSEPEPFIEMPMCWDRAYGGVDRAAERRIVGDDYLHLLAALMEPTALHRWSECAYPRNPAGKGYMIEGSDPLGLAWPNLEFPDDRLSLDRLTGPLAGWGARPYPACWDLLPYHWFPRSVAIFDPIDTEDGRMPRREVDLGLVPDGGTHLPPDARPWPILARVAHPFLQRHRLAGTERLHVSAMGPDGDDLRLRLPGEAPVARLRLAGARRQELLRSELDLVLVEAEARRVTLVWRASLRPAPAVLPSGWMERTEVQVEWE